MRFSSSIMLALLLSSALPFAAAAVASDVQEEAELEQELDSEMAKATSQERKNLRIASYNEDDDETADADEDLDEVEEEPPRKRKSVTLHIDPVAAAKAQHQLDQEISYMRNIYMPAQRSSRHPMHRASRRFSALAEQKPHFRGMVGEDGKKLAEAAHRIRRQNMDNFRRKGKFTTSADRIRRHRMQKNHNRRASFAASSVAVSPGGAPADTLVGSEPKEQKQAPLAVAVAAPLPLAKPASDVFPKSHPIVQRALGGMSGELKLLRGQKEKAMKESEDVKVHATKAKEGMQLGAAIRRKIAASKANMAVEDKLVGRIEGEQRRLKVEHDSIQFKLHKAMDPRISLRESLVKKKEQDLEKTEKEVQKFAGLSKDKKEDALETIRKRKAALGELKEAEEAMNLAEKQEEVAKKVYDESKKRVSEQVQTLNVYETRLRASKSIQVTEEEAASEEGISLDRTKGILKMELARLDQALSSGEDRLDVRLSKAKAAKVKAANKLAKAKLSYVAWVKQQKLLADAASREVGEYEDQQKSFYVNRDDVMRVASDQAGAKATAESDWDGSDWAWSGGAEGVGGDQDDDFA